MKDGQREGRGRAVPPSDDGAVQERSDDLDRRRFLAGLGAAGLLASTGGLAGCARALEWSSGRDRGAADRALKPAPDAEPSADSAGRPDSARAARPYPHLAVATVGDPEANVRAAVDALGGMSRFVKRGARVVIKPNVLTSAAPEFAVTTNPLVVSTLIRLCYDAGAADVTVLDRPTSEPRTAFDVSGIARAVSASEGRLKILTPRNFERVSIPKGRLLTSWPLVSDIFEADTFINVPIAKDHGLSRLTMAMKNLMGIMGDERGAIHVDFDQKIVDLNTLVRPHLVVLDATRILLRNGPTGGSLSDVREARTVVAGTSQVSVDAYGATLFGLAPGDLGYLARARDQGLGETDLKRLDVRRMRS